MSIDPKCLSIIMQLYETDLCQLQKFISGKEIGGKFTEEYLILLNFADDCRYAQYIQPELIKYLLPFYRKTIEQAVIYENKIAVDIYTKFNSMIFYNKEAFEFAVGEENYQYLMEYYVKQTMKRMNMRGLGMLGWVSLYNTTIAICKDNILKLFQIIFEGSPQIKYSFFKYLSVFLFKENDNLLALNEREFWTSDIWDFDIEFTEGIFWSDSVIKYFEKEITMERVSSIFDEVKPLALDILEPELINIFAEEMQKSFMTGLFSKRKCEYLKKINAKGERYRYWDE